MNAPPHGCAWTRAVSLSTMELVLIRVPTQTTCGNGNSYTTTIQTDILVKLASNVLPAAPILSPKYKIGLSMRYCLILLHK